MLRYQGLRSEGSLEDLSNALDAFTSAVSETHHPALGPTRKFQVEQLGLDPAVADQILVNADGPLTLDRAELFCSDDQIVGVLISWDPDSAESNGFLRVFVLDNTEKKNSRDRDMKDKIEKIFPGPFRPLLNRATSGSRRVREFEELTHVEMPSSEELEASYALCSTQARFLARSIKTAGDVLSDGLPTLVAKQEEFDAEVVRNELLNAGILLSEPVIICRKTGSLINRIPENSVLESLTSLQVRCSCGEPLAAEKIEEATRISPLGHRLLEKSQWMNVVLVSELLKIDVSLEDIYIEQQFGGDEVDCIAIISGDLVLFELKDGEFDLGHAYSFNAKNGMLDPDVSVVVTTRHVGNDAREHFERTRKASESPRRSIRPRPGSFRMPIFVEGIDQLSFRLRELNTRLIARDARRLISLALDSVAMQPMPLINKIARIGNSDVEE